MTYKVVCPVDDNNQVIINLPANFSKKKIVTVYVDDLVDSKLSKMEQLKSASTDSLFLADISEIQQDFDFLDNEIQYED